MKVERLSNPKNWINPKTGQKYRYFTRDGMGIGDILDWAKMFEGDTQKKWDYKRVRSSYALFGIIWVSTVWLGLDHSFLPHQAPLIFETMVFSKFTGGIDLDVSRYTTETDAVKGHNEMVKKWSNPFLVLHHFIWHEGIEDILWDLKLKVKKLIKK